MVFSDHETRWREGADVRKRYKLLKKNEAREERLAAHANRERSYYFAPKGKRNENEISTDDYYWNTRVHARERQGRNILKFPKTFGELHDGKIAGGQPKVERPTEGVGSVYDDDVQDDIQVKAWGTADLFATGTSGRPGTSGGVTFSMESTELAGAGSPFSPIGRGRSGPTISEEAQDMAESFYNSKLGDGGKAERERLRLKRVRSSREEEKRRKGGVITPLSAAGSAISGSKRGAAPPSREAGGSGTGGRSARSGPLPVHRASSSSSRNNAVADPHNLHQPGVATEWDYFSATPDAYMGGRVIQAQEMSKPFDPMDKDMHQSVLRYGDSFFQHEPAPPSIFDPPHIEHREVTVGGGLVEKDALNEKQLLRHRVHEGKTRHSVDTMKERRVWTIDEGAEAITAKFSKMWNPPKRPYRADEEVAVDSAGDPSTGSPLKVPDQPTTMGGHFNKLVAHMAKRDSEKAARRTTLSHLEAAAIQGWDACPGSMINKAAWHHADLSQGVAVPPGLLLKQQGNMMRPKSAPSTGGARTKHYENPYYFEKLLMQGDKPLGRLKLAVEPAEALQSTVSVHNVKKLAPHVHYGYDSLGNLVSITSKSHQAVVRPRSASKYPESDRELDALVINAINERRFTRDGQRALKQGVKVVEKAAMKKGSTVITHVGTALTLTRTDSGTWTQMFPKNHDLGIDGSPMSSYPGSPVAGSPAMTRVNTAAAGGLALPGTPSSPARRLGSSDGSSRTALGSSAADMAGLFAQMEINEVKEEDVAVSGEAGGRMTIPSDSRGPLSLEQGTHEGSFQGSTAEGAEDAGDIDDDLMGQGNRDDDESTVEQPEEYYKAMHRQRIRVPKYIVPTPLLDVSRRADIVLFNQKDIPPISEYHARKEKEALIAIFKATNGDTWTNKNGWCSDEPVGKWHGVTVDQRGYVIELKLVNNNLLGEFPVDAGRLKELEVLNLDQNKLSGLISESALNHLEQLEVLSLRKNNLNGDIPFRIFSLLTKLREVWLSENQLTGIIDHNMGNISNLTHFDVYHNKLHGTIPVTIANLTKLEVFSVGHNNLRGAIPDEMQACHRLTYLSLYDNKFEGEVPNWIMDLTGLLQLNLNFNRFKGYVPKSAQEMFEKKARRLERAARTADAHMRASRALSRKRREEDESRRRMTRYDHHRSRAGTAATVGTPATPTHPYENGRVSLGGTGVIMSRDFVNTPQPDVDSGYEYIRTVSRLGREMGEDGLGLNQTFGDDSPEKAEELQKELWRQGSRQRKMSVFMDGTIEKREMTVSTLPPPDRAGAGAPPPHLTQALIKGSKKKEDKLSEEEVIALVNGEPTKEEHAEAETGEAERGSAVPDVATDQDDVDDNGGVMQIERVLGASVMVKQIAMVDAEAMAEEGLDASGKQITVEVEPEEAPYQIARYPTGTPRGLLDERNRNHRLGKTTTEAGITVTPEVSIADVLDDTTVGSVESEDTLDTLLLLKANLKQNTEVVDKAAPTSNYFQL